MVKTGVEQPNLDEDPRVGTVVPRLFTLARFKNLLSSGPLLAHR